MMAKPEMGWATDAVVRHTAPMSDQRMAALAYMHSIEICVGLQVVERAMRSMTHGEDGVDTPDIGWSGIGFMSSHRVKLESMIGEEKAEEIREATVRELKTKVKV